MPITTKPSIKDSEAYVQQAIPQIRKFVLPNESQEQINAFAILATAKHAPSDGKNTLTPQEQAFLEKKSQDSGANLKQLQELYLFGKKLSGMDDNTAFMAIKDHAEKHPLHAQKNLAQHDQTPATIATNTLASVLANAENTNTLNSTSRS